MFSTSVHPSPQYVVGAAEMDGAGVGAAVGEFWPQYARAHVGVGCESRAVRKKVQPEESERRR